MSQLYRVHWKSRFTGVVGQSKEPMSKEAADALCATSNKDSDLIAIDHWVEPDTSPQLTTENKD